METIGIGQHVDVGGRRLFLHRAGDGGPSVVFLSGASMFGLDYLNLHERVAEITTSVIYDRGGTGFSDHAELPRTAAEVTDELRDLLRAAGVPAPYVLVGHSQGGIYARHYSQRFPAEVSGMVLLEPGHEDWDIHMPDESLKVEVDAYDSQAMPEVGPDFLRGLRDLFTRMLAGWPDAVREPLVERHLDPRRGNTGPLEKRNLAAVYGELRHAPAVPDVPLIVFTAMGLDPMLSWFMPDELQHRMNEGQRALHDALATSVPRGENRILDDAAHNWLHIQHPDAVLQAIHDVLRAGEPAGGPPRFRSGSV